MANRLSTEKSPYLLQHKDNPVNWYPWCKEAFQKAQEVLVSMKRLMDEELMEADLERRREAWGTPGAYVEGG